VIHSKLELAHVQNLKGFTLIGPRCQAQGQLQWLLHGCDRVH